MNLDRIQLEYLNRYSIRRNLEYRIFKRFRFRNFRNKR